jgi:GT2 family glycosyltransferase
MAVLIPTHGRPTLLERTIDSVLACTPPPDREVRLIVVENGGRNGAEEVLRSKGSWIRPEYRYHEQGNKSAALNAVLGEVDDCLLVFFDDDVRVDPMVLCHYAQAAGDSRSGAFFGGGFLIDYEERPPQWMVEYLPPSARGWRPAPDAYQGLARGLAFLGFNWAAFSSDLRAVGGFDPRFGPGGTSGGTGQERAMQVALRDAGIPPRYVYDALVWHHVPRDRCSARWALGRAYRNAITVGHEMSIDPAVCRVAGVPRYLIRTAAELALRAAGAWLHAGAEERFKRTNELMVMLGTIKGIRTRWKGSAS